MNVVELIHNEIDTAQDRLYKEAVECINKFQFSESKEKQIDDLKKLGFVNSQMVVETEEKRKIRLEAKEKMDKICYYKQTYPFLKFLTVEELDRICDKYDLIYAPVTNYIKNVPEKNIKDMMDAQPLKSMDSSPNLYRYELDFWHNLPSKMKEFINELRTENLFRDDRDFLNAYPDKSYKGHVFKAYGLKSIKIDQSGLFIAAPKSHFDLTGLTEEGKKGFFKTIISKPEPKDPIVFRYVKGGVQIITKWGVEGEDESLTNPILN